MTRVTELLRAPMSRCVCVCLCLCVCLLTKSLSILSFSIFSVSFFCSRSVLVCQVTTALVSFCILPVMERWYSLKSLACCRMLFRYSWNTHTNELEVHMYMYTHTHIYIYIYTHTRVRGPHLCIYKQTNKNTHTRQLNNVYQAPII